LFLKESKPVRNPKQSKNFFLRSFGNAFFVGNNMGTQTNLPTLPLTSLSCMICTLAGRQPPARQFSLFHELGICSSITTAVILTDGDDGHGDSPRQATRNASATRKVASNSLTLMRPSSNEVTTVQQTQNYRNGSTASTALFHKSRGSPIAKHTEARAPASTHARRNTAPIAP
jgi:hypothetical protein